MSTTWDEIEASRREARALISTLTQQAADAYAKAVEIADEYGIECDFSAIGKGIYIPESSIEDTSWCESDEWVASDWESSGC